MILELDRCPSQSLAERKLILSGQALVPYLQNLEQSGTMIGGTIRSIILLSCIPTVLAGRVPESASTDPDKQPWIGSVIAAHASKENIPANAMDKLVSRAVSIDQQQARYRLLRGPTGMSKHRVQQSPSKVKADKQQEAVKKAEALALAVAKKRATQKYSAVASSAVASANKCTNVVFSGGGPSGLMGVYSIQSGKFNGGPYYKCGKALLYRMSGKKGWAISDSLGSKQQTLFSQASGNLQRSLTDKYTMWSAISSITPGPGQDPTYNLVRRLHVHCFSGEPLSGDCDAGGIGEPTAPAYTQSGGYYPSAASEVARAERKAMGVGVGVGVAPMMRGASTQLQLQALRLREQQSLRQATNRALEQQELQQATVSAVLEEQKQAKLRRQMLTRSCLQRYETSPLLLQTCLAQLSRSRVGFAAEPPPLFPLP